MNILFTNAGRRTYLIEDALALGQIHGVVPRVFVCDTTHLTASMLVSPDVTTFLTPRVSDSPEHYVSVLKHECKKREIDIIIPLMDFELAILADHREHFNAMGTEVVVSSPEVIRSTLDKQLCWYFCEQHGLDMPDTWFSGQSTNRDKTPLISKRTLGSGSEDLAILKCKEEIPDLVPEDFLFQEMVVGQEYGIDVLNGMEGEFLHCCARRKISMRHGETDKAEVVYDELFDEIGRSISEIFRHIGNLDIDFIIDSSGKVFFIDFNPRFGGGYPFTRAAGFDYLRAIIENLVGKSPELAGRGRNIIGAKGIRLFFQEEGR